MEEPELIAALKAQDPKAYTWVVNHFGERVYAICLGFMGNTEDAEDMSQETFLEVFNSMGTYQEKSSLYTWIHRITISKCLERIRYQKRKKRFAWVQSLAGLSPDSTLLPKHYEHPGVKLEQKEDCEAVYTAISRLPESQRIAFTMSKIEAMSYQEIASTMDLSLSAVESLLFRAKRNLKKYLVAFYRERK